MPQQKTIRFDSDGYQLTGTLHLPGGIAPKVVIGCHGLLADRQSPKQIALGEALNEIGIAYLRFDHRGCGDSQGQMDAATLLSTRCRDLYHAMQAMQTQTCVGPLLGLFGSSFGGTVAMATAARYRVPAIVSYAAPLHSRTIHKDVIESVRAAKPLNIPDREDLNFDIRQQVKRLTHLLVMHGEADEIVPLEHAREIFESAGEPKELTLFPGGDHRMSNETHQQQFIQKCIRWYRNNA